MNEADTSNEIVIEIKDLKKSFGDISVLNGIDVEVFRGENLAVLGRSGSGKSVLIKIISGLLPPDSGIVKVLNKEVANISAMALQALRLKIGFSFQSSALYDSMSVRENLAFPLVRNKRDLSSKQVEMAVKAVLNDVGLSDAIDKMPSELSGGQRKRIGIARTLILKPEIMLYDEPTAGLDPITCMDINNLILQVQQEYKTTSIVITHDRTCAKKVANRVAMIVNGKFLAIGSFDEVFKSSEGDVKTYYDYNFINDK